MSLSITIDTQAIRTNLTGLCVRVVLAALALSLFKPVMPLVVDGLAHAFWGSVHIATVHKHQGKEHVHYEVKKMAQEQGQGKAEHRLKLGTEQAYYFESVADINLGQVLNLGTTWLYPSYSCRLPEGYRAVHYHPPWV